jgi:hypothetical protein
VLFAEYQYVNVDPSVEASIGPVNINADIDFAVNMAEVGADYGFDAKQEGPQVGVVLYW